MTRRPPSAADEVRHPTAAPAQPFRIGQRPGPELRADRQRPLLDPAEPLHHQRERDAFPQAVIIGDVEVEEIVPLAVDRGDQHLSRHRHVRADEERPFRGVEAPVPDDRAGRHHARHHPIGLLCAAAIELRAGAVKRGHEASKAAPGVPPEPPRVANAPTSIHDSTVVEHCLANFFSRPLSAAADYSRAVLNSGRGWIRGLMLAFNFVPGIAAISRERLM